MTLCVCCELTLFAVQCVLEMVGEEPALHTLQHHQGNGVDPVAAHAALTPSPLTPSHPHTLSGSDSAREPPCGAQRWCVF